MMTRGAVELLQIGHKNRNDPKVDMTLDETIEAVKDLFVTAGEVCLLHAIAATPALDHSFT